MEETEKKILHLQYLIDLGGQILAEHQDARMNAGLNVCTYIYLVIVFTTLRNTLPILTLFLGPTSLLPDNVWPKLTLGRLKNSTWTSILVSLYLDLKFHHYIFRQVGMLGEVFAEIICSEVQNNDFPFE